MSSFGHCRSCKWPGFATGPIILLQRVDLATSVEQMWYPGLNHGRLFDNRKEFLRRAARIKRDASEYHARGFRAAVLYRRPEWYDTFEFSFDMSIPMSHISTPSVAAAAWMPFFIGDILDPPVATVQDYTLFHLLNERSIALWKEQIEMIVEANGLASFIVHPDYVIQDETRVLYKDLLSHLRALGEERPLWFALV